MSKMPMLSAKDKEDSIYKKYISRIVDLLRSTPEAVDIIVQKHGTEKVLQAIPDNFK